MAAQSGSTSTAWERAADKNIANAKSKIPRNIAHRSSKDRAVSALPREDVSVDSVLKPD